MEFLRNGKFLNYMLSISFFLLFPFEIEAEKKQAIIVHD